VKDPHDVVKAGEVVKVKVLEVDEQRKRIALTMRLDEQAARPRDPDMPQKHGSRPATLAPRERPQPQGSGAMAEALANAFKRKAD
jgi:uncharacterized protein